MNLYVFGDSHAWFGWNNLIIEGLKINAFALLPNSMTCSGFGFEKTQKLNILDYGVKDYDLVIFQFGETDCRRHLIKEKYHSKYKKLIDKIVENYFYAIKINVEQLNNITTIVASLYPIGTKSPPPSQYRKELHEYFNFKFKEGCEKYNYLFLDLYNVHQAPDGFLNKTYSDGHVHIIDPVLIKQELLKIIKI